MGTNGSTGPRGVPGPAGPAGICGGCSIALLSAAGQRWHCGRALTWSPSECCKCCPLQLAHDNKRITIGATGCFVVSFTADLISEARDCRCVTVAVQMSDAFKNTARFVCHFPVAYPCEPFTGSAAGLLLPVRSCPAEFSLTLLSPASVFVNQAGVCVTGI